MNIFGKIKDELKKTLSILTEEEKFADAKVKVSDMVVGGKVEMINSDGSLSPAADGEYTIGKDVIVVQKGLIVSINGDKTPQDKAPQNQAPADSNPAESNPSAMAAPADNNPADNNAPAEDPAAEAKDDSDIHAQLDELKATTEALKTAVAELQKAMADDKTSEQSMAADFSKQLEQLNETIKTLATTPAEFSKTNNSSVVKDNNDEKLKRLAEVFAYRKK